MINVFLIDNCTFQGCNRGCDYCRSNEKIKDNGETFRASLPKLSEKVNAQILKVSGYGEITMLPNWKVILEQYKNRYKHVQVITNGTLLSEEDIKWMSSRDYGLCISLDGDTIQSNRARRTSREELERIVDNIQFARSLQIPTEINTVLSCFNIRHFLQFLEFIRETGAICYPFPFRENKLYRSEISLSPKMEDVEKVLGKILDNYRCFQAVLPPKAYIESLRDFMLNRTKRICYVPQVTLGVNPRGDIVRCACSGTKIIGNIFSDGSAFKKYEQQRKYGGYEDECKDCFTHYEIFNLFIGEKISEYEMSRLPIFKETDLKKLKLKDRK